MAKSTAAPCVGRSSSRTPFKHWILNAELGRLCGIFSHERAAAKVPARANPFLVVDLCAGDGECHEGLDSSPAIIERHLAKAIECGVDVRAVLIERKPVTYDLLRANVPDHPWLNVLHRDARDVSILCEKNQAVFIHSDPNHIHDWPISDHLLDGLSDTTTMLCTLGCNVGGLKMLPLSDRQQWYDHVAACLRCMPSFHEAVLIALDGDTSQWAYLLRLPVKWADKTIANICKTGSRYTTYNLSIAAYRDSRNTFLKLQDKLFLTAKERLA